MNVDLQDAVKVQYQSLKDAPSSSFRRAFVQYCYEILALQDNEDASPQLIAQFIAGAMFIDGADDNDAVENITARAGLLEVPAYFSHEEWNRLLALIDELAAEVG